MREILFRGKRVDNGEWAVSNDIFLSGKRKHIYIPNPDPHMSANAYICREIIPETISEFTGLTDKNGTKIFEGDIVKLFYKDGFEIGLIGWSSIDVRYKFASPDGTAYGIDVTDLFEVIGNIHDNPELLESEVQGE